MIETTLNAFSAAIKNMTTEMPWMQADLKILLMPDINQVVIQRGNHPTAVVIQVEPNYGSLLIYGYQPIAVKAVIQIRLPLDYTVCSSLRPYALANLEAEIENWKSAWPMGPLLQATAAMLRQVNDQYCA